MMMSQIEWKVDELTDRHFSYGATTWEVCTYERTRGNRRKMPGLKLPTAGSPTRLADLEPSAFWLPVKSDGRSAPVGRGTG